MHVNIVLTDTHVHNQTHTRHNTKSCTAARAHSHTHTQTRLTNVLIDLPCRFKINDIFFHFVALSLSPSLASLVVDIGRFD